MVSQDWKNKNYNMGIRVSEQTVQKLRAGKTFENNVAAYKKSGGDKQTLEAMNRFYGKQRVSSALGNSLAKTSVGKAKPPTAQHSKTGNTPPKANPTTLKTPTAPKPSGPGFGTSAGNFIKNELLGVDDFSKLRSEMKQHRWGAMAKSFTAGSLELGTTIAAVAGAVFTGGGTLAAEVGAKAAATAARQVGKEAVKTAIKKASAKELAKTVATGSIKGGLKTTGKTALKVVRPIKTTKTVARAAGSAIRKQALKNATNTAVRQSVRQTSEAYTKAAAKSAVSTATHKTAKENVAKVTAKYTSKYTKAGKKTSARGAAGAIRSAKTRAAKTAAIAASDRAKALGAKNAYTAANAAARKAAAERATKVATNKARQAAVKKIAVRSQGAHVAAHYGTQGWYSSDKKKGKK